jgi:hypothetical protein
MIAKSTRSALETLARARAEIGQQLVLLKSKDLDEVNSLNAALGLVLKAEEKLKEYFDKKEMLFTGKVYYVSNDATAWIGKLDDGTMVIVRTCNLGPSEKLIKTNGCILVDSYGGSRRIPPFIRIG